MNVGMITVMKGCDVRVECIVDSWNQHASLFWMEQEAYLSLFDPKTPQQSGCYYDEILRLVNLIRS